ncbi:hypothetical protein O181_086048 [Austropuccinia psidii MF-1]|uniref:Integrase catalytic domain-containing protein n=1 Tax=Austropuccinia psidii MF-1 TaxID=1389203 RepID=A0A9Q3FUA7_9BASI|nr:hypothetical protein [Austropuccinia psidii MF-1]
MWHNNVAEYFKTCEKCQKANKSTGKRLGNMIKIQEPRRHWEIVHMDLVTGLPSEGDRSSNPYVDDKAIETALLIWNTIVSWTGIFTNIISDRDPNFTSALWKTLHQLFGTKLSFSIAYHPNTDGLAERMIQSLEDMARRFSLELAYNTSIQTSTNQTLSILEKGWNPKLPHDSLRKKLAEIHPTAVSFKGMLEKARKNAVRCMEDSFTYTNNKWDKSHATPDFKVGDSVLVSPTNFNIIKGCKRLKNSFA